MISKTFKILIKLLKAKYDLFYPKQCDVLVYDKESKRLLEKLINLDQTYILNTRYERFNILIFFQTLISFNIRWSNKYYIEQIIKIVNPKIIITGVDNVLDFWDLKKSFPKIKTIFFQNGLRSHLNDVFSKLSAKNVFCIYPSLLIKYYCNILA